MASSFPSPFCTVATQPSAKAWAVASTAAEVCIAFVATMPKSHGGSSAASDVARSLPSTSPGTAQPETVAVDRGDVVRSEVVSPDLHVLELREVGREERSHRTAADDAHPHASSSLSM